MKYNSKIPNKRNQKLHYSPLRYPGGKTFLFPFFDDVMQQHGLEKITYIEPFAGGAGAAVALLLLGKVNKIVINDLDRSVYCFWKVAIFHSEKFIKKIHSTPVTIAEWKTQKIIYANSRSSQFERGFATFFLNRTNVSGILNGGPIGGAKQQGKYKINARFNKERLIKKIYQLSLYKDKISVLNRDGLELINDYLNKKNTFIYLDPPYFEKGSSLYLNHYTTEDHKALAKKLNKNPNAFWLLTYDDRKEIRTLYPNRQIINFSFNYNAYKSRKGNEMMIFSNTLQNK